MIANEVLEMAIGFGFEWRDAGYNGAIAQFAVVFDVESDLIAFQDLVEEYFNCG